MKNSEKQKLIQRYEKENGRSIKDVINDFKKNKLVKTDFKNGLKLLEDEALDSVTVASDYSIELDDGIPREYDLQRVAFAQFARELSTLNKNFCIIFSGSIGTVSGEMLIKNGVVKKAQDIWLFEKGKWISNKGLADETTLKFVQNIYTKVMKMKINKICKDKELLKVLRKKSWNDVSYWLNEYLQYLK